MHSLHCNLARELFSRPRGSSQQNIAKLFSLVCFAHCALHRATIPPLYLCHFSCYGVVALLWRVSPVKLPLLGIYRTLQNARAEKLMFHILPLSAAFPLILNCSWCTAQSLTPQVPGYWTILVSWLWNKKQLFLGFVIPCVSWNTAEANGQVDDKSGPQYQS